MQFPHTRDKALVRSWVKGQRKARAGQPAPSGAEVSKAIAQATGLFSCAENARVIASFMPLPGEPDVLRFMEDCASRGLDVLVPAWDRAARAYNFCRWTPSVRMFEGPMRVQQPADPVWIGAARIDAIVVPGLAFDSRGGRIGFGGGFYDRLLPRCVNAVSIGICFAWQLSPVAFRLAPHDIRVNLVVAL